jgi:hypothetical protein
MILGLRRLLTPQLVNSPGIRIPCTCEPKESLLVYARRFTENRP